uniref:USP domain-containing protein n=1 Tax=Romanomermis culicivorax TaxID=13658 RepID=A0A915K9P8_ROMCU
MSEITCLCCKSVSTTFDPFLDISLEIKKFDSIEQSFRHFTRMETLTGDNAYKCPKCSRKVTAHKSYSIHEAPNILTIQLKRFDHFGKIDKSVSFSEKLNLRPFMSQKQGRPVIYKLYGVVVHSGRSTNSGHYYGFVRNPLDQWHLVDDSRVCVVSPKNVLHSAAYLLFYIRLPVQMAAVKPQPKAFNPQEQEQKQENLLIRNDSNINSCTSTMKNDSLIKNYQTVLSKKSNPSGNYNGVTAASTPIVHAVAPLPQFIPRSLISNNNVQRSASNIMGNKTTPNATVSQNHTKIKIVYHNNNNNSKFTPRIVNRPTLIPDAKINETANRTQNSLENITIKADIESSKPNLSADSCSNFDVTNSDTSTFSMPCDTIKGGSSYAGNECRSSDKMIDENHNAKRPLDKQDDEESTRKKRRRKEKERKRKHRHDEKRERSSSSHHSKMDSSQCRETSNDNDEKTLTKRRHSPSPTPRNTFSSSPPPSSSTKKRRRDNNDQDCRRRQHRRRSKSSRQSRIPEFYCSRSPATKIIRSEESEERRSTSSSRRSHSNGVKKDEHAAKEKQNNDINRGRSSPKDNNPDVEDRAISGRKLSNDDDHPQMSRKEKKRLKKLLRKKRKSENRRIVETTSQSPIVENANEKLAELKAPPKKIVIPSPLEFLKTFCKPSIKTWEDKNSGELTHNPGNIFRTNNDDSEKQHSNDLDDDEMDAGKTKKVKKNFNQYRNDGWNPFQYAFDAKMAYARKKIWKLTTAPSESGVVSGSASRNCKYAAQNISAQTKIRNVKAQFQGYSPVVERMRFHNNHDRSDDVDQGEKYQKYPIDDESDVRPIV